MTRSTSRNSKDELEEPARKGVAEVLTTDKHVQTGDSLTGERPG